jgi:hypothetical protein
MRTWFNNAAARTAPDTNCAARRERERGAESILAPGCTGWLKPRWHFNEHYDDSAAALLMMQLSRTLTVMLLCARASGRTNLFHLESTRSAHVQCSISSAARASLGSQITPIMVLIPRTLPAARKIQKFIGWDRGQMEILGVWVSLPIWSFLIFSIKSYHFITDFFGISIIDTHAGKTLFSCKMMFIMNQQGLFSPIAIHIHIQWSVIIFICCFYSCVINLNVHYFKITMSFSFTFFRLKSIYRIEIIISLFHGFEFTPNYYYVLKIKQIRNQKH